MRLPESRYTGIHENLNAKKKRQVLMHEAHSPRLPFGCCNAPEFLSPATGILSILLSLASGNRRDESYDMNSKGKN